MHDYLSEIKSLQSKINTTLNEGSFEKLAILSSELESAVKTLVSDPNYKNSIRQQEIIDLKNLRAHAITSLCLTLSKAV